MNIVRKIIIFILLFFLAANFLPVNNLCYSKNLNPIIKLAIDDSIYEINNNKINGVELTNYQKKEECNYNLKLKQIDLMKNMGFNSEDILKYLYPYLYFKLINIINNEVILPQNAFLCVEENTAKIKLNPAKSGLKLNKLDIFDNILYNLQQNIKDFNVKKEIDYPKVSDNDIKKYSYLKSNYKTSFINSSEERKNNIKLALKSLDGVTVYPNEIFSFNEIVGKRTKNRGYKQAKVISNGKFIESFGGGVCQASTTLYNSVLIANLEVVEVHSHSLKIGYIEPGFDAMVNGEVSDFKFKNNTEYPIIIATSSLGDICNISIYGVKNNCEIKRKYESVDIDVSCEENSNVLQPASKVKASLLIYKDNQMIEERFIREVYYKSLIKTE